MLESYGRTTPGFSILDSGTLFAINVQVALWLLFLSLHSTLLQQSLLERLFPGRTLSTTEISS